VEVNAHSHLDW